MRFFRAFDAEVFHQLKACVPLTQMAVAQARAEDSPRGQFEDVVGTAISYPLSDGRDVADSDDGCRRNDTGTRSATSDCAHRRAWAPMRFRADEVQG